MFLPGHADGVCALGGEQYAVIRSYEDALNKDQYPRIVVHNQNGRTVFCERVHTKLLGGVVNTQRQ
jgi:hypothetical protein